MTSTVTIVGNLTRDPELRFTPAGQANASFVVAVNRRWQNRQTQEWEEATSFFDVVAWAGMAQHAIPVGARDGTMLLVASVVVLLGCSGAGKSVILREAERLVRNGQWQPVNCVDTDRSISEPDGGHIYGIHLRYGRLAALSQIESRERALLNELGTADEPCLIAAGPALVSHDPQFSQFVERAKPRFVYLQHTSGAVLEALKRRRERHAADPAIASHRDFGSWDLRIRTKRRNDGTFELLPDAEAIVNIGRECAPLIALFEQLTAPANRYPALSGPLDKSLDLVVRAVRTLLDQPAV